MLNTNNVHATLPSISAIINGESGSHTYGIILGTTLVADSNDSCTVTIIES
jgi:hypothetical protein